MVGAHQHGIRVVDFRHEMSAAFAAEGWSKLTRTCGIAAVTAGPGVTNAVSALGNARGSDSPLLLIGGRAPVARWGMGSLQEMDHLEIVGSLVKRAATLAAAEDAYSTTAGLIALALSARTGPTFVDVPLDVFFAAADLPAERATPKADPGAGPDLDSVKAVIDLLRKAERPAIVAGGGVWWAHAEAALVAFAEAADVPVYPNGLARGILPPSHRLFRSRSRKSGLGEADLVLVVGAPLDFRLNFGQPPVFADEAQIVYVDADDFRKHRPAAAALYGDICAALRVLAEEAGSVPRHTEWLERLAADEKAARERDRPMLEADTSPVHPARLVAEVDRFLDRDAVVVGDGGDFVSFAGRIIERDQPGLWVDAGPFGCLGSGPGYAAAAKLLYPDRQVLLLQGDGAFGFSGLEFEALVRQRIPIVTVIGNNGIWALEKHPMRTIYDELVSVDLTPGARYDKVVEALGGHGECVDRPEQIRPALERAFASGVPACVNVLCDPEAEYPRSSVLI
jgi:acetolactate synthase-1/2/3 large subunit